jgi:hypothetical protein
MPVTLASSSASSWITRALEADPEVDLQKLTLAQLAIVNVDPDALVIVEGACPDVVPGQDVAIVAPKMGTCLGLDVLGTVDPPPVTSWETGDSRLRFLTLDGLHVAHATPLRVAGLGGGAAGPTADSAQLVRAGNLTLVGDASLPGRTVTVVGFDVADSDWPLKASFVIFVRNLVELAKLHRAQGAAGPVKTGDPLRVAVPAGVTSVHVEGPGMVEHEVAAKGGFAVVPAVDRAGFYTVRWTAPHVGHVVVAASLTSARESNIAPRRVFVDGDATRNVTTATSVLVGAHHEWTTWLAVAAAILLLVELFWLTRGMRRGST